MTKQRDSREMALKFLFCQEFAESTAQTLSLKSRLTQFQASFSAPSEVWKFTSQILQAFQSHQEEVDSLIQSHLQNWTLDRVSLADKNLLRIALSEMLYLDTPPKVALNEAIDLGKKYSTSESASFINALLDRVLDEKGLLE